MYGRCSFTQLRRIKLIKNDIKEISITDRYLNVIRVQSVHISSILMARNVMINRLVGDERYYIFRRHVIFNNYYLPILNNAKVTINFFSTVRH